MANEEAWRRIIEFTGMAEHDFESAPFVLKADDIKAACLNFIGTSKKEPRILCKQDTRNSRPEFFRSHNLFILPKRNGDHALYYIVKGEGYVDVPDVTTPVIDYRKQLDFDLLSSRVGNSEMQHLDYAYANSLIRTFMDDPTLVLSIRGRKFTSRFSFRVGDYHLEASSVQTEVDAGYEGRDRIVLVEAKNAQSTDNIIRQLYYPYRQWLEATNKPVVPLFFERRRVGGESLYYIWQFRFTDSLDYNSIELVRSARYRILPHE